MGHKATVMEDHAASTPGTAATHSDATRLLIVDDDEPIRTMLGEIMRQAGYDCSSAPSGEKALELLNQQDVDIVITDIKMPGLDGFGLTEIIKQKYTADVIVITGYGGEFGYEEAMEKGASDFALKPLRPQELITRVKRVLRERALLAERGRMEDRLRQLTVTDELTKLYNSRHFFKQLQSEVDRATRYDHPLSLLLIDVDNFKEYNDSYGHLQGNKLLAKLGEIIKGCLRKNDSGYRYGGDEFTVVLPATHAKEAARVAERIRKQFGRVKIAPVPGTQPNGTVSVGIAEYNKGDDMTELINRADAAMYRAKKEGGNQSSLA
jgi:diguanylate cyclase (GGDEF)-like protein